MIFYGCSDLNKELDLKYPKILPSPITENYWGVQITDSYRDMEKINDSVNVQWYKAQNELANSVLNKIKGKPSLIEKMKGMNNRYDYSIRKIRLTDNENYFYLKKNTGKKYFKLFYRKEFSGKEEFLFDPESYKPKSGNDFRINYIQPSWDGNFVAIAMSYDGKELSDMVIYDVKNRKVLPEIITNCWPSSFLGVNWLPDNSGFTYLHFPIIDPNDNNFKKNTKSVLYMLGQNPKKLNVIYDGKIENKDLRAGNYPTTKIHSSQDNYIIGYLSGVDSYWTAYYTEIKNLKMGTHKWKPLYKPNDKVYRSAGFFGDDDFIFKSAKNSSNYTIERVNRRNLDFNDSKIIVKPKGNEIVREITYTKSGLFFTTMENGVKAKLYHQNGVKQEEIELPKKSGNIYLRSIGRNSFDIWVYIDGWINKEERYKYLVKEEKFVDESISQSGVYPEFKDFKVDEIVVPSHDGELVPLSIIYDKSKLVKNGKNPVLINGYGAYGDNITPYFSTILLSWVKEGGIFCTAHVRGGGEKGDSWHKGGFKTTKPNSWKDFIACAEYLVNEKYTSNEKISIFGSSAGGILIGNALVERPDLFASAIIGVGDLNPLRQEAIPGGSGSNYKEFGTVKDSIEAMALIKMDAYLKVKNKNEQYPALLLTAGINDVRVPPWVPGKFVARMQNSDTRKPVLFDVNYNSGHSQSPGDDVYEQWGNFLSFALWQTGHPDYQLKE